MAAVADALGRAIRTGWRWLGLLGHALVSFIANHRGALAYSMLALSVAVAFYFGTPGSARKIEQEALERDQAIVTASKQADAALRAEALQRCIEGAANRSAIRAVILRGLDVGKPGTPGYAYYVQHPEEIALARQRTRDALRALPEITC